MILTAIKEHGYGGRRIKVGQDYEVHSDRDRVVLLLAGLVKPKKQPAKARILTTDNTSSLIKNRAFTREEQPEEQLEEQPEGQREEQVEKQDAGQEQIDEQTGKPRRQRRQYKRHDMVPEN